VVVLGAVKECARVAVYTRGVSDEQDFPTPSASPLIVWSHHTIVVRGWNYYITASGRDGYPLARI